MPPNTAVRHPEPDRAEALPVTTGLHEFSVRAQRVQDMFGMPPRWRNVGPLVLDLFHRDARNGSRRLSVLPREFVLIWRLADKRRERVTWRQSLKDVWRIDFEPEANTVEVHDLHASELRRQDS